MTILKILLVVLEGIVTLGGGCLCVNSAEKIQHNNLFSALYGTRPKLRWTKAYVWLVVSFTGLVLTMTTVWFDH